MTTDTLQAPPAADELRRLYARACAVRTDINEHLPVLRKLAEGCDRVVELGTRGCNSTLALLEGLRAGGRLDCYDTDRWPQVDHIERMAPGAGVVFAFHQEDVLQVDIGETDLLFIDTWHVEEQLRAELKRHAAKVRRYIVLHDTESYAVNGEKIGHRGLGPAVKEFLARGTFKIHAHYPNNNGLTVLERCRPESEAKKLPAVTPARVYLGIPYYTALTPQAVDSWDNALDPHGEDALVKWWSGSAFHDRSFNDLWCDCYNKRHLGWTHFAMVHSDVRPDGYWLSTMLRLLREHDADLLSVVLPIKTDDYLSSTAVLDRKTGAVRRLTMREVLAMSAGTFDAAGAGFSGCDLLASTGLWVCRLPQPVQDSWVKRVWFESRHRIVEGPDGLLRPETVSEDWAFSHALRRLGLRVMATREVPAGHWGVKEYRNDEAAGRETDAEAAAYGAWYEWQTAQLP